MLEKDQMLLQQEVTGNVPNIASESSLPVFDNTQAKNMIEKLIAEGYGTSNSSPYRDKIKVE